MAENMQNFITGIIIVGVILIVGIYISSSMQGTLRNDHFNSTVKANESLTTVTETGESVAANSQLNCEFSYLVVINGSNVLIPAANYTHSGCTVYSNVHSGIWNNTDWKVSYTYSYQTESNASTAAGDLVTALSGGTAWITILVVVGFAVIVLGMLTSGLGRAAEGTGPVY